MSISLGTVSEMTKGWDNGSMFIDQPAKVAQGAFNRYDFVA
jgi:hypothetical protein